MRYLGGHLGITVSALLDGQLDPPSAERAWTHVHGCATCRQQVEREGWVKTQLAAIPGDDVPPPPELLGSLYGLGARPPLAASASSRLDAAHDGAAAWAAVHELERRGRGRRRAGIALVGAGSVSAAVLGLASLTGTTLGIGGGAPSPAPTSALTGSGAPTNLPPSGTTMVIAPAERVHGRLRIDTRAERRLLGEPRGSDGGEGRDGLRQ